MSEIFTGRSAEFFAWYQYRSLLWRVWSPNKPLMSIIGLNPSTAGAQEDDATTRVIAGRCVRMGLGGFVLANLYQFCSTDPGRLRQHENPFGDDVDESICRAVAASNGGPVIAAWGTGGTAGGRFPDRPHFVLDMITRQLGRDVLALRISKEGHPCHPLRIPYSEGPVPFRTAEK